MRDVLSFWVVVTAGFAAAMSRMPEFDSAHGLWLASATLLAGLAGVFAVATVRSAVPRWFDPAAPWVLVVAMALLREGTGGSASRASLLVALPIVWAALFGRLWHLVVTALLAGLVYTMPALLVGPPTYVREDWHRGLAWLLFGLLIGPTISRVVSRLRENEASLSETVTSLTAMRQGARLAAVVATDARGVIVDFNGGAERLFGRTAAEIAEQGATLADLYLPEELESLAEETGASTNVEALNHLALSEADSRIWTHLRGDGTQIYARSVVTQLHAPNRALEMAIRPRSGAGAAPGQAERGGLLMVAIDATSAITSRRELVAARDESDRLFEDSPHAIAVVDATTSRLLRVNEAFAVMFARSKAGLVGRLLTDITPTSRDTIVAHLTAVRDRAADSTRTGWKFDRHEQPTQLLLSSTLLGPAEPVEDQRVLITMTDISTRFQYEQQLSYLADHDTLTGLANRRLLRRRLSEHLELDRQPDSAGALLLVDLDHFKEVNDNLGHAAGDELLIEVARRMSLCVRSSDLVARLGGDEFAVLLIDCPAAGAQRVATSIVKALRDLAAQADGPRRHVTASVGVVNISGRDVAHASAEELLSDADIEMYRAKGAGRDQFAVKGADSNAAPSGSRFAWRSRLTAAIDRDLLLLHLQPVRSVASGAINGAEVLVRLADTDQLVYPNEFLPVAERSDLIVELDLWVIARSVDLLATIQKIDPRFRLEMNLSGRSIGDPRVEHALCEALNRSHCDARGLIIEITETAAIANLASAREFAERVMSLGCRFALDDFGAGYGSFYYLKHLLFDFVKIDGEFISRITENPIDQLFVRSIVGLAKDLGKKTVAEYVENDEIYRLIAAEGVDYAQGYGVGRPVPIDEFMKRYVTTATMAASEGST